MILIIGYPTTYESTRLKEELAKKNLNFKFIRWQDIVLPFKEIPELCLIRGSVDLDIHFAIPYMETIIEELERMGCITIPPLKMITKCDKATTYLLWKKYLKKVIRMPESIITVNLEKGIQFLKNKKIAVFKPMVGGLGRGIELIKEDEVEKLENLVKKFGIIFLQEFIPNRDYDIRTVFIGDDFISQYIRYNPSDFRNNIHLGGQGRTIEQMEEMDPDITQFCEKSEEIAYYLKAVIKFNMFGIDTIPSKDGKLYFLEINPFFGFQGMDKTNNTDVAKKMVEFIIYILNNSH
ncbi:MAG: RimK family alpha-L-glutamate ligase [Promethearchaeota archaeon]